MEIKLPEQPKSAFEFALKIHDGRTAVLPYLNNGEGVLIAKGSREFAMEFDPPGNMLEDFNRAYPGRKPDGWAVLTGPGGYVVLDCETTTAFEEGCRIFPSALKTFGSKGGHIHLRMKDGTKRRQYKDKTGKLVFEVLVNWQVPLPGSIHRKTGNPYLLLQQGKPEETTPEKLNDAVQRILKKCNEECDKVEGDKVEDI